MDEKERKRIANKKWYDSHQEQIKAKRIAKKDKQKNYGKNHYLTNKEKYKDKAKQWAIDNPLLYKKQSKIARWKRSGMITDDWENVYSISMNTTNCDYCKKEFMNSLDRCLDHDHSIKDNNNIRGILCRPCNVKDVLKGCPPIF